MNRHWFKRFGSIARLFRPTSWFGSEICQRKLQRARSRIGFLQYAVTEALEPRLMLSSYQISGGSSAQEASPYTLTLTTSSTTGPSWLVNWGDGTPQHPDITPVGGSSCTTVQTQHPYPVTGSFTISAQAVDGSATYTATGTPTVVVSPPTGEPQLQVQGFSSTVLRQDTSCVTLARVADVYGDQHPGAYSVGIDWGDGSDIDQFGTLIPDGNGKDFDVIGSPPYTATGTYQPHIIVTHDADNNAVMTQSTLSVSALDVASVGANSITLSYSVSSGEQLSLEEAGPGDLNYHTLSSFSPNSTPGIYTYTVNGLTPSSHYNFRLRQLQNGAVQYSTTFADTNDAAVALAPPSELVQGASVSGQTAISFEWNDPHAVDGFTVTVRRYSDAAPLYVSNVASSIQNINIPSSAYSSNNLYTINLSIPNGLDQYELLISDGPNVSPTIPLSVACVMEPLVVSA